MGVISLISQRSEESRFRLKKSEAVNDLSSEWFPRVTQKLILIILHFEISDRGTQ